MIKSALYAAIGFAAMSSIALAQDLSSATAPLPPGTFTTSAHSDEWKIANALSAGPASITVHAAVIDWPANPKEEMSQGRVLRQGTNGWTCMPDVPGRPQHDPMCVNETMMTWLMATLAGQKPLALAVYPAAKVEATPPTRWRHRAGGAAPRSPSVRPWTWLAHLGNGPPRASPSRRKRRWMLQVGCET